MEIKAKILDNKQELTSILFIPRMFKLVVILFLIKLFTRKNIFKYIKKKHLQDMVTIVRSFEQLKTKYIKTNGEMSYNVNVKKRKN